MRFVIHHTQKAGIFVAFPDDSDTQRVPLGALLVNERMDGGHLQNPGFLSVRYR